ncbi:MAG: nucleotidyltransferase domain-containing protein [Anaerolineales bacterium]
MTTLDKTTLEKLPEITTRIVKASHPDKIILLGSYGRGDDGPDSDLDLLVVISGIKHLRAESTRLRGELRGLLVPVDIVVTTPEQLERLKNVSGLIYHRVMTEGKVVYERPQA